MANASKATDNDRPKGTFVDWITDLIVRAMLSIALSLAYERRIRFMGRMMRTMIAPLAGYRRRAITHLALADAGMPADERRHLADGVADNFGRTLAEIYSGAEFANRIAASDPLTGPGLPVLLQAIANGRPVILTVAHFGNYDAMRAALVAKGITVGAVYRPMDNPYFNDHYSKAIHTIARPLFPRNRAGTVDMMRFLRKGGVLALGVDQYYSSGEPLRFFGLPAWTTISPATLALKYEAPLIPIHAIRQPDGLSFEVRVDAEIPRTTAKEMMQAVNDNLEQLIRSHMDQWFWVHRRWKQPRERAKR